MRHNSQMKCVITGYIVRRGKCYTSAKYEMFKYELMDSWVFFSVLNFLNLIIICISPIDFQLFTHTHTHTHRGLQYTF